jgi:acyl carrier protein
MQNAQRTDESIRWEIKRLIASVTEREPEEVPDAASFSEDLGVDSLMAMEVMVAMDKKFRIDIPEEEFVKATNVDEAVAMVRRYLPESSTIPA